METATIGHNQGPSLEDLNENPGLVFEDEAYFTALTEELQKQIAERPENMTTEAARSEARSLAFAIAKRKAPIEKAAKGLTEEYRKKTDAINKRKKRFIETLEYLQSQARKPLDDWEAAEAAKERHIENTRAVIESAFNLPLTVTLAQLDELGETLDSLTFPLEAYFDKAETLQARRDQAMQHLADTYAKLQQSETEREELERLRKEKEDREREATAKEHAERLKEEGRREAEAQAERQRLAEKIRQEQAARDVERVTQSLTKAKFSLMASVPELSEDLAIKIIRAIHKGSVEGVRLTIE